MVKDTSLLKEAQAALDSEGVVRRLRYVLRTRSRLRPDRFSGGDILIDISIHESSSDHAEVKILDALNDLFIVLEQILAKIRNFFSNERKRFLSFWSLTAESLTAPLFTGGLPLDSPDIISTLLEYFYKCYLK